MRIAAISDIHGNLSALTAVLADIARRGVDITVNCGDILSGPLWPAETADLLMPLNLPTIAGNHERYLGGDPDAPRYRPDEFAYRHLSDAHLQWLAALPGTLELPGDVYLCHGRPDVDDQYLLETLDEQGSHLATAEEVARRLAGSPGAQAELVLCGHSHLPRSTWIPRGDGTLGTVCVNAGSVGLQAFLDDFGRVPRHVHQNGSPHSRYMLCERTGAGWSTALITVPYDWQAASAKAAREGFERWAAQLATGRA
jgi:predicted phosphodiesterase